jgi:hypothetical protein
MPHSHDSIALHFLIPFVIAAVVLIHLLFIHQTGSNNPLGLNKNTDKILFHPYFTVKNILGFAITIIILTVLTKRTIHLQRSRQLAQQSPNGLCKGRNNCSFSCENWSNAEWLYSSTRQTVCVKRNFQACSCNQCWSGKALSIAYSECVCSLGYLACNVLMLYCHLCSAYLYNIFIRYLIHGNILKKKKALNVKHEFCFSQQRSFETFPILRKKERDMIKSVHRSSCKVPVILVRF